MIAKVTISFVLCAFVYNEDTILHVFLLFLLQSLLTVTAVESALQEEQGSPRHRLPL